MAILMPTTKALTRALTRRRLLVAGAASAGLTALGGIAKPHLSRAADRPRALLRGAPLPARPTTTCSSSGTSRSTARPKS